MDAPGLATCTDYCDWEDGSYWAIGYDSGEVVVYQLRDISKNRYKYIDILMREIEIKEIKSWEYEPIKRYTPHKGGVTGCCYVDGNLYTCGRDNTVQMLDPTGTVILLMNIKQPTCIAYALKNIWVGTADGTVFKLSKSESKLFSGPITALAGDESRLFVSIGSGKVVEFVTDSTAQQLVDSPVTAMAVDGPFLCVATAAGELKEFDTTQADWKKDSINYSLEEYGDSKPLLILHIGIKKHKISLSTREEATDYVPLSPVDNS